MADKQRKTKQTENDIDEEIERNSKHERAAKSKKKKKKRHILAKIFITLLMILAVFIGAAVGFRI